MTEYRRIWEGKQWQRYIEDLLVLHYGPEDFQRIPDENQGDLGLEAFTRSGIGIQCYAPQGHLNSSQRYEKHRIKLSGDIRKLVNNHKTLPKVLGRTVLRRWFFFVPEHDNKQLIAFANTKTEEVKSKSLPYITADFEIHIHDDSAFPVARNRLLGQTQMTFPITWPEAVSTDIQDWANEKDTFVKVIDGKLSHLSTLSSDQSRVEFRNRLIAKSIEGQNIIDQLRSISPDLYERIIQLKSDRANSLLMESYTSVMDPNARLNSVVSDYISSLRNEINILPHGAHTVLGYEAVADWLALCNLNFGGSSNA